MTSTINPTDPTPAAKTCGGCGRTLDLEAFPRKRGGRGPRCKACVREYGRAHYAANSASRKAQVRNYRAREFARRLELLTAIAVTKSCATCQRTYDEADARRAVRQGLALIGELPNGDTLGLLVRDAVSAERFALAVASRDVVWRCRPCATSLHRQAAPSTLSDAIREACTAPASPREVFARVSTFRETTPGSVAVTMAHLVRRGDLVRLGRARYQVTP